jgi:hypothetical protein
MPDQAFQTSKYVSLEMRGMNEAEKSSPETLQSFKSSADSGLRTGVRIVPKQSAKHLRRNLENSGLEKQLDPALVECVRVKVLTWQGLECGHCGDRDDVSSQ